MGIDSSYLKVPGILQLADDGRQVLIFDQRGHGRSSASDTKDYTHSSWVSDLNKLAGTHVAGKFALLGHSYGGFIALEFALRYPSSLTHLILVGTSAGPVDVGTPPTPQNDDELKRFFKHQWPRFFFGRNKFWPIFDAMTFSAAPYKAAYHRELKRYDVRPGIRHLQVPTLLIVGAEDRYAEDMRWLDQELPYSQLKVISDSGHVPFIEKPREFTAWVDGFLSGKVEPNE